ncbi:MAG: hypothetical protein ACFCVC_09625 [Acidimicrobiia bacterium]
MRRALPLIVLALLVASCTDEASVTTTTDTTATPPSTEATTTTTTVVQPPPGIEELPAELQVELEALIAVTEEVRGLEFLEPPKINVVSPDELARLVREDIAENTEGIDVDQALYELLGLIDEGTQLLDLYTDVLGEQVAGFYDSETKEMVVPLRSDEFGALERSTIVHELVHALTDQHFDFGTYYQMLIDEERFDEVTAYQAVIEGDAVLTELTYLRDLPVEQQREVIEQSLEIDSSALTSAPRFLQESLIFPYVQGQVFMDRLFRLEGQAGIDAAYGAPPVSSEQIITPEDFRRDEPVEVAAPLVEIPGYAVEYESVWGELSFELMFNQVLGSRSEAAEGWGGDRYVVLSDGVEVAMVLSYTGDAEVDAAELEAALIEYLAVIIQAEPDGQTFVGEDYGHVARDGSSLTFVVASDPAVGASIVEALTAS